ncbi:sensor histidine kinase [Actinomyces oricola]
MTAASGAWAAAWSSTRLSTWAPRRRTHLLWAACASMLTMLLESESPVGSRFEAAGGLAIALVSVRPVVGGALSLLVAYVFHMVAHGDVAATLPLIGPWLCASVLLTRGYSRPAAYGLVVASAAERVMSLLLFPSDDDLYSFDLFTILIGCACLVIAELIRRPRVAADAAAERYRQDLERQRLLVVSELHDTVVRDLTRAVMVADRARLAQSPDAPLAAELATMAGSVRTAVEQLRANLQAVSDTTDRDGAGAAGFAALASSAPRPLPDVVAEARAVLSRRGITLETEGLEALEAGAAPPGMRQQLVRVLGELVSNMARYAAPGSARLIIDADGRTLEAMATNAAPPPPRGKPPGAASSGLGLAGARRRVEALGGTLDTTRSTERFTVILSVPLGARWGPER